MALTDINYQGEIVPKSIIHEITAFYRNENSELMCYLENKYGEADRRKLTIEDISKVIAFYESLAVEVEGWAQQ